MATLQQHRRAVAHEQMFPGNRFNGRARGIECSYPTRAVIAFHAEMILQRFYRDRARNPLAVNQRGEYHGEIRVAIRGCVGWKKNVHGHLQRLRKITMLLARSEER